MNRPTAILAALLLAFSAAFSQAQENIIVSGGVSLYRWEKFKASPHDLWWLNFIRAARLRIEQIRAEKGPDAKITWFVYAPAYRSRSAQEGKDLVSDISSVQNAYGVKLVYFSSTSELISYLNSRGAGKIANFEYFGHSNKACLMFDYSNEIDSASKAWLHERELGKIQRGLFTRDAFVKTWGCHCGESFTKKWATATGVKMWGAVGKTQYNTETLPHISTIGGRWVR
jgi:hypothetical protein